MGTVLSRMHACKCTHTEIIRYFVLLAQVPGSFPKTFLGHAIPGQQQGGRKQRWKSPNNRECLTELSEASRDTRAACLPHLRTGCWV